MKIKDLLLGLTPYIFLIGLCYGVYKGVVYLLSLV
jgi:hypothetical protein